MRSVEQLHDEPVHGDLSLVEQVLQPITRSDADGIHPHLDRVEEVGTLANGIAENLGLLGSQFHAEGVLRTCAGRKPGFKTRPD